MTPQEKLQKIKAIIDKYMDVLEKIPTGGKIDPELAKQLGIPPELVPIIDLAYKRGRVLSRNKNVLSDSEIKEQIRKMESPSMRFELGKEATKENLTSLLNKNRAKLTTEVVEVLKKEYNVVGTTFSDETPERYMPDILRKVTNDFQQDWDMVIKTELINSRNQGFADDILQGKSPFSSRGGETLVYKRPNPNACKHCKRLYLESDNITPKVFTLSEMLSYGTNVGKKTQDWKPVMGPVHPHCQCVPDVLPPYAEFDEAGRIRVKKGGNRG